MIAAILTLIGSVFILVAALGILRFPDLYMRMSASTKAAVFGLGLIALGVAFAIGRVDIYLKSFTIVLFMMFTAPIAAHVIGRTAYFSGTPIWKKSKRDDLKKALKKKG